MEKQWWQKDGIRWRNNGGKKSKCNLGKKKNYLLSTPDGNIDGFRKEAYMKVDDPTLVLVHYMGDESLIVDYPHGNSKHTKRNYIMSKPSTIIELAEKLDHRDPHLVYKDCVNSLSTIPRNLKQTQNIKYYVNKSRKIAFDEIYNLHLISSELNWVKHITTLPDFFCVMFDKSMVDEVTNLIKYSNTKIMLVYDTTFN